MELIWDGLSKKKARQKGSLTEHILQGTLDLVKYTAKLGPMGFFKVSGSLEVCL